MKKLIPLLLGTLATAWGAPLTFNFDTSSLDTTTGSVLFVLGGFADSGSATATISGFAPGGGSLHDVLFSEAASGDLASTLTLTFDGFTFASFEQVVDFGSLLSFEVDFSAVVPGVNGMSLSMLLYDENNEEVVFGQPGPPLLSIDYNPATGEWTPAVNIPEPGSLLLAGAGGLALLVCRRRRTLRR